MKASLHKERKARRRTFAKVTRKARKGLDPRTGEAIKIKASSTVRFKASKTLKRAL